MQKDDFGSVNQCKKVMDKTKKKSKKKKKGKTIYSIQWSAAVDPRSLTGREKKLLHSLVEWQQQYILVNRLAVVKVIFSTFNFTDVTDAWQMPVMYFVV